LEVKGGRSPGGSAPEKKEVSRQTSTEGWGHVFEAWNCATNRDETKWHSQAAVPLLPGKVRRRGDCSLAVIDRTFLPEKRGDPRTKAGLVVSIPLRQVFWRSEEDSF